MNRRLLFISIAATGAAAARARQTLANRPLHPPDNGRSQMASDNKSKKRRRQRRGNAR